MNFDKLTSYMDGLERAGVPGCDLAVWIAHTPVYRHFTGYRDREAGVYMNGDELYWIFSATKVHTCAAALTLIERGVIDLDDPVYKYLPAYKTLSVIENGRVRAARSVMTIRHLFTMQGGLTYDLDTPSIQKALMYSRGEADTRALVNAFAEEPLAFDPGARFGYSLCHDALAAVIEAASGMRFSEYLNQNIWSKLGMKDTGFTLTDAKRARLAKQYLFDEKTQKALNHPAGDKNVYQLTPNYESGGAGLLSSVDDYILLADALACGGEGATGARILKRETIDMMRKNQLSAQSLEDFKTCLNRPGYGYGLGVRTLLREDKYTKNEFGWDGAACAYTLIDTERKLSVYFGMHVRSFAYGYAHVHPRLRALIYEAIT